MCLLTLAIDRSRRFPLVVAANRDEFFARPAARLAWWSPRPDATPILGGRDLESGGTWLGLTTAGRMAMVTNVRVPGRIDPNAPSRGSIVPEWLAARESPDRFWMRTALSGFNGFNLIAADFAGGECWWASNTAAYPQRLGRGIYGVSNALLDTPWPKVLSLKQRTAEAIDHAASIDELAGLLFQALADRSAAPDDELPATGIPMERERLLSSAFIRTPDQAYGTRCSTLVITERTGRHNVTHMFERTFSAHGGLALLRRSMLRNWPPRYNQDESAPAAEPGQVNEAEDHGGDAPPPPPRTRVRSLLKPPRPPRRR